MGGWGYKDTSSRKAAKFNTHATPQPSLCLMTTP